MPFQQEDKVALLGLARRTIERRVLQDQMQPEILMEPVFQGLCGVFVTLHRGGELRGCIGRIRASGPLYLTIQEMAVAASTQDFRFSPVEPEEVSKLEIEISVLTEPQVLSGVEQIQVGVHGLIVSSGRQSGLLLPQVATEYGWDAETFLSHTCLKAGLPMDFWTQGQPKIEAFTADVFSEKELGKG